MIKSIPNILTILRIIAIPIIISTFYIDNNVAVWIAVSMFVFASITDFLDGYLARVLSAHSALGKCFDPIADKLLIVSIIVMLIHKQIIDNLNVLPAIAIICREILVSGMREFLSQTNISIPVSNLGKWKTAFQMLSVLLLLLSSKNNIGINENVVFLGLLLLWISAVLTIITGYNYFKAGIHHF